MGDEEGEEEVMDEAEVVAWEGRRNGKSMSAASYENMDMDSCGEVGGEAKAGSDTTDERKARDGMEDAV